MSKNKIITAVNRIPETKIILGLLGVLILFFSIYVYFIANTVLNVVARKEVQSKVAELRSETSELEEKYISMQNSITKEYALSEGFKETKNVRFVSYVGERNSLTLGN